MKFLKHEVIANAFLHSEKRTVDKTGCISFDCKKYEVSVLLRGCVVDVVYDPKDTSELTIEYEGHEPIIAKPLKSESGHTTTRTAEHLLIKSADSSRILKAAEEQNHKREAHQAHAISYSQIKDGEENV